MLATICLGDDAAGRQPEENVGAGHDLCERPLGCLLRIRLLVGVHQLSATRVNHALDIRDPHVLPLQAQDAQQVQACQCGGTSAGAHELHVGERLANDLEAIEDGCRHYNCRAVLIVVEHRDAHALLEAPLDLEALRRLDVLEIDAAERRLQPGHGLDKRTDLLLRHLDVEDVDASKLLEENGLAFHYRLGGERTDVAKPQHRRPVRDHTDQIAPRRQPGHGGRIARDLLAGMRDTGRIGECQVRLICHRLGGGDGNFAWRVGLVIVERGLPYVDIGHSRHFPVGRIGPHS